MISRFRTNYHPANPYLAQLIQIPKEDIHDGRRSPAEMQVVVRERIGDAIVEKAWDDMRTRTLCIQTKFNQELADWWEDNHGWLFQL